MGYVREAGMSTAARRKRRRTALVISSLLMIVVVGFLIAVATMQGWLNFGDEDGTTDDVAITSSAPAPLAPSDITINVYNSTDTAGLASRAAEALEARGYQVDEVGNDQADVERVANIRHGPDGLAAAEAVKATLPKWVKLEEIEREGEDIDLILGDDWKDLPTAEDAEESAEG